jgi:hypothetical protein
MAMVQKIWSINALAVELEVDRRTLATALKGIAPDGKLGSGKRQHDAWKLLTALVALGWGQGATGGDGESYAEARRIWMNARAKTAEHEAAKAAREAEVAAGTLVPIKPVSEARAMQFKLMANHLMRLPSSLPPLLVGQDAPKMQAILKDAIYEALNQIANCEIKVSGAGATVRHSGANEGATQRASESKPAADTNG